LLERNKEQTIDRTTIPLWCSLCSAAPHPFNSQQWYVKLALKLLWERQLGSASGVEGYVNVLPAQGSFETLIHWTDQVGGFVRFCPGSPAEVY